MIRKKHRLDRVAQAIRAMPIRAELLDKAFERFRETGELPDEQRLADAVCRRVLNIEEEAIDDLATLIGRSMTIRRILVVTDQPKQPSTRQPSVRECLLHEAVFGNGVGKRAARIVLMREVDFGADPTDPSFLADKTFPKHGSIGMHLLGFPERLAKRPYVIQAKRLFARFDVVCDRINQDDPMWGPTLEAAVAVLNACGDLPGDDSWRDVVLAILELNALIWHRRGEDVRGLMAALDAAGRLAGDEREAAIGKVQELVRSARYGA